MIKEKDFLGIVKSQNLFMPFLGIAIDRKGYVVCGPITGKLDDMYDGYITPYGKLTWTEDDILNMIPNFLELVPKKYDWFKYTPMTYCEACKEALSYVKPYSAIPFGENGEILTFNNTKIIKRLQLYANRIKKPQNRS